MSASHASRTSLTSTHKTVVQKLYKLINTAVERTTADYTYDDKAQAHRFLSQTDLSEILNSLSLQQLFKELLTENSNTRSLYLGAISGDDLATKDSNPSSLDVILETYVKKTLGKTPRVKMLALFLYTQRVELLMSFMEWLVGTRNGYPSDNDLPFSLDLIKASFPSESIRTIREQQNIFRPVEIEKDIHQSFKERERLPFVGAPVLIGDGSSGTVYNVKIAQGHWLIKEHGPSNQPVVVAIKSFDQVHDGRSREEATTDFEDKRRILDDIRTSRIRHEMILLDWGSITITDESGIPIRHSLIFQLATFSLVDFLTDNERAMTYTSKNVLFAKLVDTIEALAYLHDKLSILHLDIKPDNILVFEGSEMIWKLSDFGLARKRKAKARTGLGGRSSSHYPTKSSGLPAPRNPGTYQAPEIQRRDFSKAGRRSDVWSVGCITLAVLAFVTDGVDEVLELEEKTKVNFRDRGGRQSLFYASSNSFQWDSHSSCSFDYGSDLELSLGNIPNMQQNVKAVVHPHVVEWSNKIYDSYGHHVEKPIVRDLLDTVFRDVLLIDCNKRTRAGKFGEKLVRIQQRWKAYEDDLENSVTLEPPLSAQPDPIRGPSTGSLVTPDFAHAPSETTAVRDVSVQDHDRRTVPQRSGINDMPPLNFGQQSPLTDIEHLPPAGPGQAETTKPSPEPDMNVTLVRMGTTEFAHSDLCLAIINDEYPAIVGILKNGNKPLKLPCARCNVHPLHKAMRNNKYRALDLLVENADVAVTKIPCPESGFQTAFEMAVYGSGDSEALECFFRHREKFVIPNTLLHERRKTLNTASKNILKKFNRTPSMRERLFARN
ncbi:hypothetical protein OPT61_g3077 [Boeremia exigua]|uniref:Uncharacterized protein n=1 Tax=Boeremia exigua TaxID=749465 RepID=A0ACC2IJC3_9PLEO|nr:hypothetical protein OPT61_g3077 [Boeremia exigua]